MEMSMEACVTHTFEVKMWIASHASRINLFCSLETISISLKGWQLVPAYGPLPALISQECSFILWAAGLIPMSYSTFRGVRWGDSVDGVVLEERRRRAFGDR